MAATAKAAANSNVEARLATLRDDLTKQEASDLIERLSAFQTKVAA